MTPLERSCEEYSSRADVSPATRRFYKDGLAHFLRWAEDAGIREPAEVTGEVAESYARDLEERVKANGAQLAPATRAAYLRALRMYLSWASRRRGLDVDHKGVPMPRLRRQHRDVLSPAEMEQLEDAAPIERDKLIVRVMVETGARLGEVAGIRKDDLVERDRRFHFLKLQGKTGQRLAPISASLYRRLLDYGAGKSGRPATSSSVLFMAHRRRNRGDYEPLTTDGVYQVVKDSAERAKIKRRMYPHLLRHSRITAMVAAGMNLVTVSEIVGVSIAVIAATYAHQTDEQRHEAMMKVLEV
jgi:integrase/recombinase XerD